MHWMTPNWIWTLSSQKYFIHTICLPLRPKFCSVLLYKWSFPRYNMYKVGENRKCTEWPQTELEHLTVKNTLYTLNTYPWRPNFGPLRSTISRMWDKTCTRSAKIGNAPNDPKLNLTVKSTLYTLKSYPWGPNFHLFHSMNSRFWDTRSAKSECTEWPQTEPEHLTVKSTLNTLNIYPWGPNFGPFRSTTSHF